MRQRRNPRHYQGSLSTIWCGLKGGKSFFRFLPPGPQTPGALWGRGNPRWQKPGRLRQGDPPKKGNERGLTPGKKKPLVGPKTLAFWAGIRGQGQFPGGKALVSSPKKGKPVPSLLGFLDVKRWVPKRRGIRVFPPIS